MEVVFDNWPYTLIPNKLVSSLIEVRKTIGYNPPLLEELAADIFMGSFTQKYFTHAKMVFENL